MDTNAKRQWRAAALASFTLCALLIAVCGEPAAAQGPGRAAPLTVAPVARAATAQGAKEATVFGQRIHYVETGSGPTVVLLPDQLGHGLSAKPFINYRIGTYVDFLDKFLDELKVERATLVGNSMGGWIAAAYTLKHPAKVERLVLVDAAGFAPPKEFDLNALAGLNPSTRDEMK